MPTSSEHVAAEPTTSAQATLGADLHARPAGQITRIVALYDANVLLVAGERTADTRSVLAVMGLGALSGQRVTVLAEGPDAAQALEAVIAVLQEGPDPAP